MLCSVCGMAFAQKPAPKKPHIKLENGKMEYDTYRYVDYSFCGYRQSDTNIPDVPVKAVVNDAEAIQAAIDYVGKLPADKNGHRGAVLLGEGTFEISQRLHIANSGTVFLGLGIQAFLYMLINLLESVGTGIIIYQRRIEFGLCESVLLEH